MPIRPQFGELVRKLTDGRNHRQLALAVGIDPANIVRARAGHVGRPATVAALADGLDLLGEERYEFFEAARVTDPGPKPRHANAPAAQLPEGLSDEWRAALTLHLCVDGIYRGLWFDDLASSMNAPAEYRRALDEALFKLAAWALENGYEIPDTSGWLQVKPRRETEDDAQRDALALMQIIPLLFPKKQKGQPES